MDKKTDNNLGEIDFDLLIVPLKTKEQEEVIQKQKKKIEELEENIKRSIIQKKTSEKKSSIKYLPLSALSIFSFAMGFFLGTKLDYYLLNKKPKTEQIIPLSKPKHIPKPKQSEELNKKKDVQEPVSSKNTRIINTTDKDSNYNSTIKGLEEILRYEGTEDIKKIRLGNKNILVRILEHELEVFKIEDNILKSIYTIYRPDRVIKSLALSHKNNYILTTENYIDDYRRFYYNIYHIQDNLLVNLVYQGALDSSYWLDSVAISKDEKKILFNKKESSESFCLITELPYQQMNSKDTFDQVIRLEGIVKEFGDKNDELIIRRGNEISLVKYSNDRIIEEKKRIFIEKSSDVSLCSDNRYLAVTTSEGFLRIYDLKAEIPELTLEKILSNTIGNYNTTVSFSPNGKYIAVSKEKDIIIFEVIRN